MAMTDVVDVSIGPELVCYLVIKAKEFDVKVDPVEPDPGSNPADGGEREVLVDYADDPTYEELTSALGSLNQDQLAEIQAMIWLGRGDFDVGEWAACLAAARDALDARTIARLTGIPLLGDFLEEGYSQLGHNCEDVEIGRL